MALAQSEGRYSGKIVEAEEFVDRIFKTGCSQHIK
jgi:hypothetical protein